MSENEPAQMIEGRYRIVRNIAEGGMATVYEAIDERLGRTVAIKVMHTQLAKGPHREQLDVYKRQAAQLAKTLVHGHHQHQEHQQIPRVETDCRILRDDAEQWRHEQ